MKSPKKPDFIMLELLRSVYEIYYIDCTKQAIRNEFYNNFIGNNSKIIIVVSILRSIIQKNKNSNKPKKNTSTKK